MRKLSYWCVVLTLGPFALMVFSFIMMIVVGFFAKLIEGVFKISAQITPSDGVIIAFQICFCIFTYKVISFFSKKASSFFKERR